MHQFSMLLCPKAVIHHFAGKLILNIRPAGDYAFHGRLNILRQQIVDSFVGSITAQNGVVAGTPAGLLDTQLANDLDIHDTAQIQRFPPPQV